MEKKEYRLEQPKTTTSGLEDQLNEWYEKGYEFVAIAGNHIVFKKTKKPKKD